MSEASPARQNPADGKPIPKIGKIVGRDKAVDVKIKFEGLLASAVEVYQEFYQVAYGDPMKADDLVREVFRQFVVSDRDFKKWAKETKEIDFDRI